MKMMMMMMMMIMMMTMTITRTMMTKMKNLCSQSVDDVVPVPPSLSNTPSLFRPRFCNYDHDVDDDDQDDDVGDDDDNGQPGK